MLSKGVMGLGLAQFFLVTCFVTVSYAIPKVIELDEDNWQEMLQGEWMVEFFAPWCPACKTLQPVWRDFSGWSDDLGISIGQVDVTSSPGLSGRFMVTALPTIFHIKEGVFRQYRGSREIEDLMSFIEEKKWEQLEEVSAWRSPGSYQMAVVAQFFKLSMVLRGVHTSLVEDYSFPTWGSYLLFGLATIVVGALLGVILVCIIDFMYPQKSLPMAASIASNLGHDEEDLIEDKKSSSDNEESEGQKSDSEETKDDDVAKSGSEGEEELLEEKSGAEECSGSPSSSPSVRKRKPRKDD